MTQLLRPAAADRVLIVAPHPDDETIGAAAYAFDALQAGAEVSVAFVTAGDAARFSARILHKVWEPEPRHYASVGRTRIAEGRTTMALLGIPQSRLFFLGYPDAWLGPMLEDETRVVRSHRTRFESVSYEEALSPGAAYTGANAIADLRRVIAAVSPTTIIGPVDFDLHSDHAATAVLVDRALDGAHVKRLGYVVHTTPVLTKLVCTPDRPLLPPEHLQAMSWTTYPVSPEAQRLKLSILKQYRSQRPYTFLLRNSFIRSNELFFPEQTGASAPPLLAPSFSCASLSSPYSP